MKIWGVIIKIHLSITITVSSVLTLSSPGIEKPREILRHQQTHRPLFIDRRLIQHDPKIPSSGPFWSLAKNKEFYEYNKKPGPEEYQLDKVDKGKLVKVEAADEGHFTKAGVEKPQIRHGRSRGHLGRPRKIEEPEIKSTFSSVALDQLKGYVDVNLFKSDGYNYENVEPIYSKLVGPNDTLYVDVDDFRVSNFSKFLSGDNDHEVRRTELGRNLDRNSKPHFVEISRKSEKDEELVHESSTRVHDVYGVLVHHPTDLRGDEYVERVDTDYVYEELEKNFNDSEKERENLEELVKKDKPAVQDDIVTRFLRIIENQHLLGENCTAGTDLNLGEGVVDQYAQERFRLEANFAVNRANMLTRLWKYAPEVMLSSEYLLHASVLSMVEFDEDIFAAGNCYDKMQYKDHWLYCPFAHRLPDHDGVLVKDLAIEYKYLSNSSEWFYIARKNAERVIASNNQFSHGYHSYTLNESTHTDRIEDEILTVRYEDGRWSKPYYDCGGGNIWMLTYTVPFFGYANDTYFFKGTSGIDIDLRRVDIDQCPLPPGSLQLNIFAASDKCKKRTTECIAIPGLGFRRGSYRCICKRGFYYPDIKSTERYYNGTVVEEEFEKLMLGEHSQYSMDGIFECLPCAEGCEYCENGSPCVVSLNWLMRTALLILECCVIACLPVVILFTWKYGNVKVVKAASPVLLRVIVLGAFFIYFTTIVMYPRPNVVTCTIRVWLREIGFSLTYGALMLKTWRISVIFRVKSAKAVKITDMNLLKRLGIIVTIFTVFLGIRTIVAPPVVIVGRTADDLKAYLCKTDWWDHSFTTLEVMFLVWGIRLCIVVRKAPSEFNESRFISMAIYNEFLLSVFLNVSMLFLQSPANPDLMYIIFFCHTQLTVTPLLGLIFGSKAYVVFRGGGKEDAIGKLPGATGKFIGKTCRAQASSNQTNSISLQQANFTEEGDGVMEEFRRLYTQLEMLREKNMRLGNRHLAAKILAMQEASNRSITPVPSIQGISATLKLSNLNITTSSTSTPTAVVETNVSKLNVDVYHDNGPTSASDCTKTNGKKLAEGGDLITPQSDSLLITDSGNEIPFPSTSGHFKNSKITDGDRNIDDEPQARDSADRKEENIGNLSPAKNNENKVKDKDRNKNKSGHARTHAIIINLDDKSRCSEEVTV
ncbi:probable G-protein coupled receptor CG31760 [Cotesia glomerata]|uniref:probable G-protein coupled receptor CG31760 n=1 Tax=Cotesia glomerata TaxID=32391 RepID=UPI001D02536D|nr:probable G-protein coupled receptor CG31760 [Cotesia glomerata]XP_044576571.1 probable G-protein coupled receptor CG31760 [Cotesia glomerata]